MYNFKAYEYFDFAQYEIFTKEYMLSILSEIKSSYVCISYNFPYLNYYLSNKVNKDES